MQERIRSLEGMIQKASAEGAALQAQQVNVVPMAVDDDSQVRQPDSTRPISIDNNPTVVDPPEDTIVIEQQPERNDEVPDANMTAPEWPVDLTQNHKTDWASKAQSQPPETVPVERSPYLQYAVPSIPTGPSLAHLSPLPNNLPSLGPNAASVNDVSMTNIEEGEPRVLRDGNCGDPAYYGSTTQLHVHSPEIKSIAITPENDLPQETTMNMDSQQLCKALLRIFFKIQPNSQIIVHEDLFMRDRKKGGRHRFYSNFLENTIMAAGTRNSTSSAVRKLGRKYAERAKAQISSELEQPNIASLQGFLLLSDFEATRGRARLGWTYSIIATGLLVDLALHVDLAPPDKDDNMKQEEAAFRETLLLGTFVYATLWSLYLGRPTSISSPVIAAVRRIMAGRCYTNTLDMWVALCLQMVDIVEILNSLGTIRHADRSANLRLCSLEINLRSVFDRLPHELAFDDARIDELDAEAYGPHMQYFGMQVTIHRAMIKAGQSGASGRDDAQPKSLDHLYAVVHENAVRIAKLVLSYRHIFGLENVITVMLDNVYVAAVALASHIIRMRQLSLPFENDVRWLRSLYEVLEAVEKHYPVTLRMRSSLTHFLNQTSLTNIFPEKVIAASPNSMPGSITGIATGPPAIHVAQMAPMNPPTSADATEYSNLDFTLTTEDDWWLHDSAWNMTTTLFST
ncbi:hypothetical protein AYO21_01745 [Fonsecaea monophora]|uniref:Xylanolytic transcriptional activator regulatory domain-containing protein n=1 Tax=Fonsecaea monophora TaxID=254056 RepID=A0A177FHX5_9EURO|nr:hypothetical protein AYO21_01745 [Fonsecaea monophora]OAG43893.1 hypothetical protein AYO21_01745 [Fonsecaea monophora]